MGALESNTTNIYGIHLRESANDGSDFSNGAADYRVVFLGEDGALHAKDSSGTVTSLSGDVSAHTGDTSDAHDASAISVLDTAANFTGTDVEAVLAELQDNIDAVGGGTVVAALVTRTSALNVTSTPTAVTWDNEVRDDGGIWSVGSATRMTAPSDGWYTFGANISHGSTSNDSLRVQLQLGGTTVLAESWNIESTNAFSRGISISAMKYLTTSQYIETIILGSGNQALNVGDICNMWMHKVGG